jgi:hypothetical protein
MKKPKINKILRGSIKKPAVKKKTKQGSKIELYLNPRQIRSLISQAEKEGEVIVIRCLRKTPASKPGGPDQGQVYDLHCTTKPANYKAASSAGMRKIEDKKNGVLTVFVTNRQDELTKQWGAWRRVNLEAVQKVTYKAIDYEVKSSTSK